MPQIGLVFRIERSDESGQKLVCACDNIETARAALRWAQQQYPAERLVLRNGEQIVAQSGIPNRTSLISPNRVVRLAESLARWKRQNGGAVWAAAGDGERAGSKATPLLAAVL